MLVRFPLTFLERLPLQRENQMIVRRTSPFTGKTHEWDLPITWEQVQRWENGELIQDAFPNLTPGEREFLLTGITPDEWEKTFGPG